MKREFSVIVRSALAHRNEYIICFAANSRKFVFRQFVSASLVLDCSVGFLCSTTDDCLDFPKVTNIGPLYQLSCHSFYTF